MRELSIEEKARAYDKAIERANDILKGYDPKEDSKATINYIFPELQESEDERIRNTIIRCLKGNMPDNDCRKECITWLEKQGERKPADKEFTFKAIPRLLEMIEPTNRAKVYCQKLIDSLIKEGYVIDAMIVGECLKQMNGEDVPMATMDEQKSANKVESKFHEGDWVVDEDDNSVHQIKCVLENVTSGNFSYDLAGGGYFPSTKKNYHLWSIEDAKDGDVLFAENFDNIGGCIFLFKGLDSWKFDAEGDRAIATGYCCTSITESGNTEFGIQGPDCVEIKRVHPATKEQRDLLFQKMHEAGYTFDFEKKELKKLKFRVGDEVITENEGSLTITRIDEEGYWSNDLFICDFDSECIWDLVEQNPAEWSEEDEKRLKSCLNILQPKTLLGNTETINTKWLKSLKERYTWKPSDEQMNAFEQAYNWYNTHSAQSLGLNSLYYDLKKLKGE